MSHVTTLTAIRLPLYEAPPPPVKIFDAEGRLVRIVSAEEFRGPREPLLAPPRRRRERPRE